MVVKKIIEKYKVMPIQIRASFWFLICSFMQKGISVITTPIFTRLLTASEYGEYSVYNSWLGIISIFVTLKLSAGVFSQGLVKYEEDRAVFASSFQGLTFVLTLIWTVVYFLFVDFWNDLFSLSTVQMLAMLVMIWATSVFELWAAEQRVKYNYRHLVGLTLLVSILKPTVGIIMISNSDNKVLARILGLVIVELICYVGLFFVQMYRGKTFFSKKYWKYALQFNIPLIPHYLSQTVLSSSDRIMVERFCGDKEAGIYSLAYSVSSIMLLFNTALMSTISPWIYKKIKIKKVEEIVDVSYITMYLIAGINIVLIALAPEVVAFFAPKEYYEAIWVIPPVAMSVFFIYCYDLFAKFQFYFEKTNYIAIASVAGAVLNLLLNYMFIPIFGYYVAGYTTLVCYIAYVITHYCFMRKVCKENLNGVIVFDVKKLLFISVFFVLFGFVFLLTYNWTILRYALFLIMLVLVCSRRKEIIQNLKKVFATKKRGN